MGVGKLDSKHCHQDGPYSTSLVQITQSKQPAPWPLSELKSVCVSRAPVFSDIPILQWWICAGWESTNLANSVSSRQIFLIHQMFTKYSLQGYSGLSYTGLYISSVFVESEFAV